ncbi:TIM barrel protein [Thermoflexus sp.]|uniref:TIM barrel protein n=1 Tax=Thermoflexus sp. TaxID=1969742 RepID=UPI0035E4563A
MHELGLEALELAWVRSVRVSEETCRQIRETAQALGIALSVHAPYFINLNAKDRSGYRASRERLMAAARAGYLAGARDIVFHPGSYQGARPERAYETVRRRLQEIVEELREEGVEVILRPETMGKSALFGTLDEVIQLSREVPGVLPCIDFAHLHARAGDGSLNSYEEFTDALRRVAAGLGPRGLQELHIHVSGIAYTRKGERHHLNLKEADLRYEELLRALIDMGGRGRVLCESPNLEEDALLLQGTYRRLLAQAGK